MRGERVLLRIGEYLVGRACRPLPGKVREDRYREWAAELPAILHDPEIRFAPRRVVRMLGYAADTLRGAALTPGSRRHRLAALWSLWMPVTLVADLVAAAWEIRETVRAPEHWINYAYVGWALFIAAWLVGQYVRPTARITELISLASCLAGTVVFVGHAVQAPGDWVNYFVAPWLFVPVVLLFIRPGRATARRKAGTGGR